MSLSPFSAVIALQTAAIKLRNSEGLDPALAEHAAYKELDAVLDPLQKEGKLNAGQLRLVDDILKNGADARSRARALDTLSLVILSPDAQEGRMPSPKIPNLPPRLLGQNICQMAGVRQTSKAASTSKALSQAAIAARNFHREMTWKDAKDLLAKNKDLSVFKGIKTIRGEGSHDITDDVMEKICIAMPQLEEVDFGINQKISDKTLVALARCPELKRLVIKANLNITDAGIKGLMQGCIKLTLINLKSCNGLKDGALKAIGAFCPNLLNYNMYKNENITSDGVGSLAEGCRKLNSINFLGCRKLDDGALRAIGAHCSELQHCSIVYNANFTNEGVEALVQGCKMLTTFHLGECKNLSDGALRAIGVHCPLLTHCDIAHSNFTNEGIEELARGCKELRMINIWDCSQLDDRALKSIGAHCPHLVTCDVGSNDNFTRSGVEALVQGCKKLKSLKFSQHQISRSKIDDKLLAELRNKGITIDTGFVQTM